MLNRIPFSEDELKIVGEFPAPFPGMPPIPKYNTPISPAGNYEALLKGERPQYFNKEPLKVPSKHGGKVMKGSGSRRTDGTTNPTVKRAINLMKCRGTVWDYLMAGDKNPLKRKHPAPFPDQIPTDFITCFCPPDGIVLDPFMGSGSTAVTAKQLDRNFIGFEISKEYCDIAEERLRETNISLKKFLR